MYYFPLIVIFQTNFAECIGKILNGGVTCFKWGIIIVLCESDQVGHCRCRPAGGDIASCRLLHLLAEKMAYGSCGGFIGWAAGSLKGTEGHTDAVEGWQLEGRTLPREQGKLNLRPASDLIYFSFRSKLEAKGQARSHENKSDMNGVSLLVGASLAQVKYREWKLSQMLYFFLRERDCAHGLSVD